MAASDDRTNAINADVPDAGQHRSIHSEARPGELASLSFAVEYGAFHRRETAYDQPRWLLEHSLLEPGLGNARAARKRKRGMSASVPTPGFS